MQILKDEIKLKIIEAGKRCFRDKGFNDTSMKEIAQHAGISTGNIYRYFFTKKHILNEILSDVEVEIKTFIENIPLLKNNVSHSQFFEMLIDKTVKLAKEKKDALIVLFNCEDGAQFIVFKNRVLRTFTDKIKVIVAGLKNTKKIDNTLCEAVAASLFEGFTHIVKVNIEDIEKLKKNLHRYMNMMIVDLDKRILEVTEDA